MGVAAVGAALRAAAEERFEAALRSLVAAHPPVPADAVPRALAALVAADDGPPLAAFLQRHATLEQFREFVVHRSVYHLKEADPHTWAHPPARRAGQGRAGRDPGRRVRRRPRRPDARELFRTLMAGLGLDPTTAPTSTPCRR